jgi:hypothetical protein
MVKRIARTETLVLRDAAFGGSSGRGFLLTIAYTYLVLRSDAKRRVSKGFY